MACSGDRECLVSRLSYWRPSAEGYLVRQYLPIQRAVQSNTLKNALRLTSPGNPADGLAAHKCDLVPLSAILKEGAIFPGNLPPSQGVATSEPSRRSPGNSYNQPFLPVSRSHVFLFALVSNRRGVCSVFALWSSCAL